MENTNLVSDKIVFVEKSILDNDDNDESYEVSNQLVDQHIAQTCTNFQEFVDNSKPFSANLVQLDQTQIEEKLDRNLSRQENPNPSLFINFINRNSLKRTLESNSNLYVKIVETNDRNHISEYYMNIMQRIQSSPCLLKHSSKLILLISISILIGIFMDIWFQLIALLIFTVLLIKVVFRLIEFLIAKWLDLASDYSQSIRNLLTCLREAELVSLSVERRFMIETKTKIIYPDDLVNLEFRKMTFLKLRHEFYRLRKINLDLNKFLVLEDLLSSIAENELADVLRIEDNQQLETRTDYFSLACLKSLAKLLRLVLSENFKLIVAVYFKLSVSREKSWLHCLRVVLELFRIYFGFRKSISDFSELKDVLDLKNLINGILFQKKNYLKFNSINIFKKNR